MTGGFKRPKNRAELEDKEVAGLWQAIAASKELGESGQKITLEKILGLHKTMLGAAYPEVAGRFRDKEDVKKLKCTEPPPGRLVRQRMYAFWRDLDSRIAVLPRRPRRWTQTQLKRWRGQVIELAAWVQYQIAAIHPFCEGNGRMARLMTNTILRRYGLPPSQMKYEGENKAAYLDALCQIDHAADYEPLQRLILRDVLETYRKEERIRRRKQA